MKGSIFVVNPSLRRAQPSPPKMLSHIVKPPLFNIVAKYAGKDAFPRGCAATSLSPESPFSAPAQRCCGKELLSREVCASTVKGESAEETSCCGCHCAEGKSGPAESCSERGLGRHVNLKVLIFYDSESHKAEALARGFARQISGESAFSSAADFPAVASARVLSLPPSVAVSDLCLASAGAFGRNFIEARVEPLQADVFEDLMDLNAALQEEKARAASGRVAELQPLPQPLVVFLFLSECGGKLRRAGEAFASEAAVARSDRRVSFRPLAGSSVSLVCLHEGAMQADTAPSAAGPSKSGRISNSTSTKTLKASRRVCALLRSLGAVSLRELCGGLLPDSPEASSCVPGAGDLSSVSRLSEAQFQTLALSCEAAEATTTQKFERWARLQKAALSVLTNRRRDKDGPSTGVALDGSAANPASRERASSSAASSEGGGCFSSGASLSESETESEDALEGLGGIGVGGSCGTAGLDGEADVEDLLLEVSSSRQQAALVQSKGTRDGCRGGEGGDLPEQLTASLRRNLEKEGYKMVGSHSAVKLCRWTRSALRGRGGCYKHTFYGIRSYGCMEFTSSVACANRCLFCWRHHTNLAAKEWAWKQDDPRAVLDEAVEKHLRMIRELRGPCLSCQKMRRAASSLACTPALQERKVSAPFFQGYPDCAKTSSKRPRPKPCTAPCRSWGSPSCIRE